MMNLLLKFSKKKGCFYSRMDAGVCFVVFVFTATLSGCQSRNSSPPQSEALIAKGRAIYQTQCIACHNPDPHKPGSIGPDVFGSSKELLEARVLRADYPQGYTPKRPTRMMVALPHLKGDIDSIHVYLNSGDK